VEQKGQRAEIDKNNNRVTPARRQALLDELRGIVEEPPTTATREPS
jgi:hypothetical protein